MELRNTRPGFRGDLLTLGREARGLTQQELARAANVSQGFVSFIESGQRSATPDQIALFAQVLGMPRPFFELDDPIVGMGVGEVFHRRRKSIGAKELSRIHAWMNVKTFAVRRLLRAVEWPSVDLPTWTLSVDVESEDDAAQMLRAKWYVPPGPIRSVATLLDQAGIMTIPMNFPTLEMDAIGQWVLDLPPLVFTNPHVPQDRLRFTLMHEVAHLVMHQRSALISVSDQIEAEANRFAAAFLLPRQEVRPELKHLTVSKLGDLKRRWRVSMAALVMRARQLETITPAQERALWVELGRNGWRKREPAGLDVFGEEVGRLYRELVRLHRQELGYSESAFATLVNLSEDDVREWILPSDSGLRLVG
jgi:Zn-dependent peptidase ImmA (M78 family)/transcriptional regulator with XRE-family HTH domain